MCRNIKTLFNFDPPVTDEEVRATSVHFVRKLSGFDQPSRVNHVAFERSVLEVSQTVRTLIDLLSTNASPRDRELEAEEARARTAKRFA